jgi:hypothetical protein
MTENADSNQGKHSHPGQFKKGQSGNPAGKPRGTRHAATLAAEVLLDGEAETLTRKAIEMAKAGNVHALRLCLDRIAPPRKSRKVAFDLPLIESTADLAPAFSAVIGAMAAGELAPDEAMTIAGVLELKRKAIETIEIERRLSAIEATQARQK